MKLRVKNWRTFQHYKDRNPPWIKLHFALLSSADWVTLDDASRVLAIACMLVASKNEGEIDASPRGSEYLKRVAYLNATPNFKPLIECGFLECASGEQADASALQANARPETETQIHTETEKSIVGQVPDVAPRSELKSKAKELLGFLNAKTGRNFEPVAVNLERIEARLKEGASFDDCKSIIAKKCGEWSADEKMAQYLRPATLFNREKFWSYHGQLEAM